MAKYLLQELDEGMSNGQKPLFPKMQQYSQHDFETVIKHMRSYVANFSEGSIRAVLDALVSVMESWMPMGHSIKIDGLGVFSLSLGFDTTSPTEKALSAQRQEDQSGAGEVKTKYRHVCIKGINFKPDHKLLEELNRQATFERAQPGVVSHKKCKLTAEERLAIAKDVIGSKGYMTLSDYAIATGQSRAMASRDLKRICADDTSGICTRGTHSHKVWIVKFG